MRDSVFFALLFLSSTLYAQTGVDVTFSEVMFYTTTSENSEFIELYNTSPTVTLDLTNLEIHYRTTKKYLAEYNGGGLLLAPNQYAVIFENDYDFANGVYNGIIDVNALVLVSTSSSWGMANTSDRVLRLINTMGDTLDTYTYSANNSRNFSDEKMSMTKDNSSSNWLNSESVSGTPGGVNTVVVAQYDLELSNILYEPATVFEGENLEIFIKVKNLGVSTASTYTVKLFEDINNNGIAETSEEIKTEDLTNLVSGDSVIVSVSKASVSEGTYRFISVIMFPQDQKSSNNQKTDSINVYPPQRNYQDIVVNEIMYDQVSGQPEWIEFYNTSNANINIKNWTISDASSTVRITIADQVVQSESYLVLVDNSGSNTKYNIASDELVLPLPALNNSGDDIVLKDFANKTIDSVKYKTSWGNADEISLERIVSNGESNEAGNWGISKNSDGATPGEINSLSPKEQDLIISTLSASPSFIVDSDNAQITMNTKNLGSENASSFEVKIYYDANTNNTAEASEEIFSQTYNSLTSGDSIVSNITMSNLSIGSYQLIGKVTYAVDQDQSNNTKKITFNVIPPPNDFNDLVITEIMYAPNSGEPEWIEIYNRTVIPVNLKKWKLGDANSSVQIALNDILLPANNYLVISDNSTITSIFMIPAQIVVANLPAFNNSGDDVKLVDSLSRTIDSVAYIPGWGGSEGGKSLERKRDDFSSNLASNWGTTVDISGGTPGKDNSIKTLNYNLAVTQFDFNPTLIYTTDNPYVRMVISNNGISSAANYSANIYHDFNKNGLGEQNELLFTKDYANLAPSEEKIITYNLGELNDGNQTILGEVQFLQDERISDNLVSKNVTVIFAEHYHNDVVINEIMYKPKSGQPEWLELFNRTNKKIDLRGFRFGSIAPSVVITNKSVFIPAQGYVIVAASDAITYDYSITSEVIVADLFSFNNSNDEIVLYDDLEREIDYLRYTSAMGGNEKGISLERISVYSPTTLPSNWESSIAEKGATPGSLNSVVPLKNDLLLKEINLVRDSDTVGSTIYIDYTVLNKFNQPSTDYVVELFHDKNYDGIGSESEKISSEMFSAISGRSQVTEQIYFEIIEPGQYQYILNLNIVDDPRNDNNSAITTFEVLPVPCHLADIIISEFMYAPNSEQSEWIEIYNLTNNTINLFNWQIGDRNSKVLLPSFDVPAGAFVVISDEANLSNLSNNSSNTIYISLPSLNNSGDDIKIFDAQNNLIDSVSYSSSWGGKNGYSLERKILNDCSNESTNWESSINIGGSAGGKNTITPELFNLELVSLTIDRENIFEGNNFEIVSLVKNVGQNRSGNFAIEYYLINASGESKFLSKKVFEDLFPTDSMEVRQEFKDFVYGNYNVLVKVVFNKDLSFTNNEKNIEFKIFKTPNKIGDLVINEVMYNPANGEGEWIELFNSSNEQIDLYNWEIKDAVGVVTINSEISLAPNKFLILADDTIGFSKYGQVENVFIQNLPSFNNSGDQVIIKTQWGNTIDSLEYEDSWGGNKKSLERKDIYGLSNLKNNWSTSNSVLGATPGYENSITQKEFDLRIAQITIDRDNEYFGSRHTIQILIINEGKQPTSVYGFEMFVDKNGNNIPDSGERIYMNNFQALAPGDSKLISYNYTQRRVGLNTIMARVNYFEDERDFDNFSSVSFEILPTPHNFNDLVINEIMYKPLSGKPEWIELFNNTKKTIKLKNWSIHDSFSKAIFSDVAEIQPNSFVVVSDSKEILSQYIIEVPLIIANLPSLNNGGDVISLTNQLQTIIDSVHYKSSWGGNGGGISLERVSAEAASNDSSNWQSSYSKELATPGKLNSEKIKEFDLELSSLIITPTIIKIGDTVRTSVKVNNRGNLISTRTFLNYRIISDSFTLNDTIAISQIAPNDSNIIINDFANLRPSVYDIIIEVSSTEDTNLENNTISSQFVVLPNPVEFGSVKINEIMYSPKNAEPEWIEFVNTSDDTVNISGWSISDNSSSIKLLFENDVIFPWEYFVISDAESITEIFNIESKLFVVNLPSLNNSGDLIVISDQVGNVVDSVRYTKNWGGTNSKSLERISLSEVSFSSQNWGTTHNQNGGTPGKINSLTEGWIDLEVTDFYTNVESTILPSALPTFIEYRNTGSSLSTGAKLLFYHDFNLDSLHQESELVDTLNIPSLNSGGTAQIEYLIQNLRPGINQFIVLIVAPGDDNLSNNSELLVHNAISLNEVRGDILVNEIMYRPKTGEAEWIELYNTSNKMIDLNGYQLADSRSSSKIVGKKTLLLPNEYFVVANDSSILSHYKIQSQFIISKFPSLNNSGDEIIISDSLGRIIDSLEYSSSWGGSAGISIEKKLPKLSSDKIENWGTANQLVGGTPGSINSLTIGWVDLAVLEFYTNIEMSVLPNSLPAFLKIKNYGVKAAIDSKVLIYYDSNLDSVSQKNEIIDTFHLANLGAGGVTLLELNLGNLQHGINQYITVLFNEEDKNLLNNSGMLSHNAYQVNEVREDVLINEFMSNPNSGDAEWIELYNNSQKKINLNGLSVADSRSKTKIFLDDFYFEPNVFLIIAKDSSILNLFDIHSKIIVTDFPSLNNSGDEIIITNFVGNTIDSLKYTSKWKASTGLSFERVSLELGSSDINNWNVSLSQQGGTPGSVNSISQKGYDLKVAEIWSTPEFPILDDEVIITSKIKNIGKKSVSNFSVKFYTRAQGKLELLETSSDLSLGVNDSTILIGSVPILLAAEVEVLAVVDYALDEAGYNDTLSLNVIPGYNENSMVITEFMFNPFSGEPEWIEIMNNSIHKIDLKEWQISDLLSSPNLKTITNNKSIIAPGEFVVIASDSNVYGLNSESQFFKINFGALGNSGDGIIICDFRNSVIDSLSYKPDWGILQGQSIERININESTISSNNWMQSVSSNNGTPGFPNSLWSMESYEEKVIVFNEIMANPNDDNSEFIEVLNKSDDFVDIGGWTLTDNSGKNFRLSEFNYDLPPNGYFVFSSDSLLLNNYTWLNEEDNYQISNSSSFALTNNGEEIILKDIFGNRIDSVSYNEKWNNKNISFVKNKSLERISPFIKTNYSDNWSTSVSNFGATPGHQNSIFNNGLSTESKLSVSPNPFSPDADGFEDNSIISYNLTQAIAQIRIRVFDSRGRLVRTLASNLSSGSQGQIIFDGFDDSGRPLRIGIYILLIEALNSNSGIIDIMKEAVVVARKI